MNFQSLDLTPVEKMFVDEVVFLIEQQGMDSIHLRINRMADKTLNFRLTGCQIGRVNLQGRKTRMQVITTKNVHWYENEPFEKSLVRLKQWMVYIKQANLYDPARMWTW